jgi:hypothetical protein
MCTAKMFLGTLLIAGAARELRDDVRTPPAAGHGERVDTGSLPE